MLFFPLCFVAYSFCLISLSLLYVVYFSVPLFVHLPFDLLFVTLVFAAFCLCTSPPSLNFRAVCLRMDPNKSQFFRYDNIILTCQDHSNATGWTVRRKTPEGGVRTCSSSWGSLSSSSSSSCTVSNIYPTDSGVYWCESTDGKTSNAVNITITGTARNTGNTC